MTEFKLSTAEDLDDGYISEPCSKDRHRRCKESYIVLVKKECFCECDCHVTNEVEVEF